MERDSPARSLFAPMEIIPIVIAYFFVYGAINALAYYNYFGIDILTFISLNEIFSFSVNSWVNILIHIVFWALNILLAGYVQRHGQKFKATALELLQQEKDQIKKIWLRLEDDDLKSEDKGLLIAEAKGILKSQKARIRILSDRSTYIMGGSIIFVIVLFTIALIQDGEITWANVVRLLVFPAIGAIIGVSFTNLKLGFVTMAALFTLCGGYFTAQAKARRIFEERGLPISFVVNGEQFEPDSTNLVVGYTDRYIFCYQTTTKSSTVIPIAKVDELRLQSTTGAAVSNE